jgi:hypothetical protein
MSCRRLSAVAASLLAVVGCSGVVLAYEPGSGTLFTTGFELALDSEWEQGNGLGGNPSPWERRKVQGDFKLYADGDGPSAGSPSLHWARRRVHPVEAVTVSVALEFRGELGAGYTFDLDLEQRAEAALEYRLRVGGDGSLSLWRGVGGSMTPLVSSAPNAVPAGQTRWIRFAVEQDASGHPLLRGRVWDGGPSAEPSSWIVEAVDTGDTLAHVHRFELQADGPSGVETWVDDLDVFGDGSVGVASTVETIYLVEWSHLDIGFTEPPDDVEAFAKSHLDSVLINLATDPDYRWTIESGWWLDRWWERSSASEREDLVARLREGRLGLTAGYANLTTTVSGHEELTRNLYWSTRFGREHGIPVRTWIQNDVPGSTFAVPELLARSGVEYYVSGMNTSFGGRLLAPDHGDRPFWWIGPDGSRVLSWITFDNYAEAFDYGFSFFDNLGNLYDKLGRELPPQEEAGYSWPELMLMRAFDNHYQNLHVRNLVDQWNSTYRNPRFVLARPEEFLDHMLAEYGGDSFPEFTGDFGGAWANNKADAAHTTAWIRESHRKTRAAETLLAVASAADGEEVPEAEIDFLYRRMLEVDEHSGAGGWPGYFTPEEMHRNNSIHLGYAQDARDTSSALLAQGLDRLVADVPAAGDAIVAVNQLGRERDGWVRATLPSALYVTSFKIVDRSSGAEIGYQKIDATEEVLFRAKDVPAVGYRVFDIIPGSAGAAFTGLLSVGANSLENDHYYVEIDPSDGSVISLLYKAAGQELVDASSSYRFNRLASNVKVEYDASQPPVEEGLTSANVAVGSSGPLYAELVVTRQGTPHVETRYRLYRGDDRLEIVNVLDRDQMPYVDQATAVRAYLVTFPFDLHDFEIRTETTTRFLDPAGDAFSRETHFDWHNAEHTLAFWNDQLGILYACDASATHNIENLSTFPSASISNGDLLLIPRLKNRADEYEFEDGTVGSYEIEPGTTPLHEFVHHVRATGPTFDPVQASRFGFETLEPLRARLLARRPGNMPSDVASLLQLDAAGVLLYTVKKAEVGEGLVLRMTELTGEQTTATVSSDVFELTSAERVEQDEDGGTPLPSGGGTVTLDLSPYETATVRIQTSLNWEAIQLTVEKDEVARSVVLSWTGGTSPFTVRRAEDALFTASPVTIVDEQSVSNHLDPVLDDGGTYFYLAR